MRRKVSAHVVTYNSEALIDECLQALYGQTMPLDQIIIVDNASSDRTLERLQQHQGRIELIVNEFNNGFAGAHNQAMEVSECEYCLVLNPDVILDPAYVRHLVEGLEERPRAGSATGQLLLKSAPHLIDSTGLVINRARRAFDRGAYEPVAKWQEAAEVFGVSGAAALYRREMVREISGWDGQFFDESFFAYKEDVDVAWRSRLLGWDAVYVPQAVALHERGWKKGERAARPVQIRRHSYVNRYFMMVKNDRLPYLLLHLPQLLLYEVLMLGYLLLRERDLLPAWKQFYRLLPSMLKKRAWIRERSGADVRRLYRFFR